MHPSFGRPREERILKRRDFLACYEQGRKYHSARFIVFAFFKPDCRRRFGIAVSRKVGNAVARNRVKRVLRECFRLCEFSLCGMQIVAVAKKNAAGIGFGDACAELYPILKHIEQCASPV